MTTKRTAPRPAGRWAASILLCWLPLSCLAAGGATVKEEPVEAPYGTWTSPVTPEIVAAQGIAIAEVAVDGDTVYWSETRPQERGRNAIVAWRDGSTREVTPADYNARTRVHEYGGGDFLVADGVVVFSRFSDQRLYRLAPGETPVAITGDSARRYADCVRDGRRKRLVCVSEDHRGDGEARNRLVSIPEGGRGEPVSLFQRSDFVAAPRLDPAGRQLAWLTWDHPDMPWDRSTLWLADIGAGGGLENRRQVATGAALSEPEWGPDGTLYYVSDRSGWWNLYRHGESGAESVSPISADLSFPAWQLDASRYTILDRHTALAVATREARDRLLRIDLDTGETTEIATDYVSIRQLRRLDARTAVFVGTSEREPARLMALDTGSGRQRLIRETATRPFADEFVSQARALTFPSAPGEVAHAFYYPPRNPGFRAPDQAAPPMIVSAHGGPTAHSDPGYSTAVQFWTSRGFAYLDVNYRGSSGYGRAYRDKLKGAWGVADIRDVVEAARHAAGEGLADPDRLIVRGGSAGGFVVLASHAFYDTFATGANYFGVSDLAALARDTHKFESRYLDSLVGPYPERADLYRERSPIHHLEHFDRPLIIFQGLEDRVVPPAQSERIAHSLRERGIEVEYMEFPEEGHGFRRAENRAAALRAELAFYRRVLDIR